MCLLLVVCSCNGTQRVDPLRRSRVDGLNKEAFVNRYRNPERCIDCSRQALEYIHDSLPRYVDGELRALNNMAFAYFLTSNYAEANQMLDMVEKKLERGSEKVEMRNGDIERVIGQLLRARLLQRNCQVDDSYRLLYGIGSSKALERNGDNQLANPDHSECDKKP